MRLAVMKTIIIKLHCHLVLKIINAVLSERFQLTEYTTNENDAYAA